MPLDRESQQKRLGGRYTMARPAKQQAPPPPPVTMNAAPGYDPYKKPPTQEPADAASVYGAYPGSTGNGASIGPPPARIPKNDFVNADSLWKYQRPVRATIEGVRDATGTGRDEFNKRPRKAWFLDVKIEDGKMMCARINEGDVRHQRLWNAYQDRWVGRVVILRLSNPGDVDPLNGGKATKAPWVLDPQ